MPYAGIIAEGLSVIVRMKPFYYTDVLLVAYAVVTWGRSKAVETEGLSFLIIVKKTIYLVVYAVIMVQPFVIVPTKVQRMPAELQPK